MEHGTVFTVEIMLETYTQKFIHLVHPSIFAFLNKIAYFNFLHLTALALFHPLQVQYCDGGISISD